MFVQSVKRRCHPRNLTGGNAFTFRVLYCGNVKNVAGFDV
jgi:hypothetical protein